MSAYSDTGEYDRARNLIYSSKGTYGTAGFMPKKELKEVSDLVPNIRKRHGIILGELDGQVICVPEKTRFNGNLAVYGASGSKKTQAFCVNMILQSVARKSSLVICDPKSELYEKTSAYLRDQGYTVKVFNLVTPSASDSWNCLSEIGGQELMTYREIGDYFGLTCDRTRQIIEKAQRKLHHPSRFRYLKHGISQMHPLPPPRDDCLPLGMVLNDVLPHKFGLPAKRKKRR